MGAGRYRHADGTHTPVWMVPACGRLLRLAHAGEALMIRVTDACPAGGGKRRSPELRQMEDELRDPSNFLQYLLPRPVRQVSVRQPGT